MTFLLQHYNKSLARNYNFITPKIGAQKTAKKYHLTSIKLKLRLINNLSNKNVLPITRISNENTFQMISPNISGRCTEQNSFAFTNQTNWPVNYLYSPSNEGWKGVWGGLSSWFTNFPWRKTPENIWTAVELRRSRSKVSGPAPVDAPSGQNIRRSAKKTWPFHTRAIVTDIYIIA